jgi:probable rRNA maturation factor
MDPDSRTGPASAGIPDVIVADRAWRRMAPRLETLVRRAAALGGGAGSVLLASDAEVRRLNWLYRGKNKPTNVLTFEGGDIAVASGVVRREARAAGKTVAQHLAHMVVHGALHLRGHDHGGAGEARRMEMTETRLLHRLGVPNPWRGG